MAGSTRSDGWLGRARAAAARRFALLALVATGACGDGSDGARLADAGDAGSDERDAGSDAGGGDAGDGDAGPIVYPPPTDGEVYVVRYDPLAGEAHPDAPRPMFWQSSFTTNDGTLVEWGTGDHGNESDNGVRELDPLTGVQTYVYPNNHGTADQSQYDNLHYWYIPQLDSLVIPSRGQYHRPSRSWPIGNLIEGTAVVGTSSANLFYPDPSVDVEGYLSSYNMHQAWSAQHDAGVALGGGNGGDNQTRPRMWLAVPSAGLGSFATPYVLYQRDLPADVGGAVPYKSVGRDGACFLDDYVYWVGGGQTLTYEPTAHFFRMRLTPHLTSTEAPLDIERLPDAPAAFTYGLMRADPYLDALLVVTDLGLFVYDVVNGTWIEVTPPEYIAEFEGEPMRGLLPYGSLGDFVDQSGGETLRRFYFRPGTNHGWDYDYGGEHTRTMHSGFRSIELGRR